jgi:hypothetical protein
MGLFVMHFRPNLLPINPPSVKDHENPLFNTVSPKRHKRYPLSQWYSAIFVRVPPDVISLKPCTPKVDSV